MARPTPNRTVSRARNLPSARKRKTLSARWAAEGSAIGSGGFRPPWSTPHSEPGEVKIQTLVMSVPRIAAPRRTSRSGSRAVLCTAGASRVSAMTSASRRAGPRTSCGRTKTRYILRCSGRPADHTQAPARGPHPGPTRGPTRGPRPGPGPHPGPGRACTPVVSILCACPPPPLPRPPPIASTSTSSKGCSTAATKAAPS